MVKLTAPPATAEQDLGVIFRDKISRIRSLGICSLSSLAAGAGKGRLVGRGGNGIKKRRGARSDSVRVLPTTDVVSCKHWPHARTGMMASKLR